MFISFNTEELSAQDLAVLRVLAGGDAPTFPPPPPAPGTPPAAEKAAPKAAKKAAAPKATSEPGPEPEPEDEPVAEEATADLTLQDVVKVAMGYVSNGQQAKVKAALKEVGYSKVSEVKQGDLAAFMEALESTE